MVTRTINPIHFEDLEPHRFEDLIRQLMYDFKDWKSIEATGKLGSDDGIDILAIENNFEEADNYDDDNYDDKFILKERVWIIQCKREKAISPKKVESIIENDIIKQALPPYGYILAASTNFSKKARDTFKYKLNELGIKEFYIFGKSEIEDLLFLPKYDHLLFAYFGISLQKKRSSIKSNLSSQLATKRKLIKHISDLSSIKHKIIFIRPANVLNYPKLNGEKPLWRYYEAYEYMPFNCISVIAIKHYAFINWETEEWDYIDIYDSAFLRYPEIFDFNYEKDENQLNHNKAWEIWNKLEDKNKGFYIELKSIHFDRILQVDEIGDRYNSNTPHLIVDYINDSPFENRTVCILESFNNTQNKVIEADFSKKLNLYKNCT
ncbi:restriction endonuclease [Chryseobacterium sp. ISL-6]|uniref:restriction endonuclease n=1 Tax=Chryseobacterium sp. ISL-6 TaxID=2819143 RepID=UPI001BE50178|nr:restriction endonuclease [Chryseobacterium sp. ISL-6]MBT2620745.1 restriction endonuclease [Chryseobacterium sp. ISL-6]